MNKAQIADDPSECDSYPNYKLCQSGVCIWKDLDCPITNLYFDENNNLIKIRNGPYLVIDIKGSQNEPTCIGQFRKPKRLSDQLSWPPDYPYLNHQNLGCLHGQDGDQIQTRQEELASISEEEFYQTNNKFDEFKKNLFLYDTYLQRNNKMKIYSISNHGFSPSFCGDITLDEQKQDMLAYKDFYFGFDIVLGVLCGLWAVDVFAFFLGGLTEEYCFNQTFQVVVITVSYLTISTITLYQYAVRGYGLNKWKVFYELEGCFLDQALNQDLKYLIKGELNNSTVIVILKEILLALLIGETLVIAIFFYCVYRKKRIQERQAVYINDNAIVGNAYQDQSGSVINGPQELVHIEPNEVEDVERKNIQELDKKRKSSLIGNDRSKRGILNGQPSRLSGGKQNRNSLKVYFDELKYTNITKLPKIDAFDLIASIGGYMGLLLGISFLTLVEVLEGFITVFSHSFC